MNATERFETLARDFLETWHRIEPVGASWLGVHSYDDQLGDWSLDGFEERVAILNEYAERPNDVDFAALPRGAQTDYLWLRSEIRSNLWAIGKVGWWRRNPDTYADYPLGGLLVLVMRDFAPFPERVQSLVGRLNAIPDLLRQARVNLERPARVYTETAQQTASGGIEFLRGTITPLADDPRLSGPAFERLRNDLRQAAERATEAYTEFQAFLADDLLARSDGPFAVGRELFEERLRETHFLDLTADELASVGRRLFAETRAALEQVAAEIAPGRPWPELVAELRRDHPTASGLLDAYRAELERLKAFIRAKDLVTIPANEELEVVETPPFARPVIPYAAYLYPAPFEPTQRGTFWVTPVDPAAPPEKQEEQLQEHCVYSFPLTALHEAYPGHHTQLVWANTTGGFVRKHASSDLFAEGWGFYCEQLMVEQGYFPDPRHRLFQLKDQLWRAARVVIDAELHAGRMSLADAVSLLVDGAHLTRGAAEAEVRRYAQTPTQPMTYAIGKAEILKLRAEFAHWPLREFHDRLLASGSLPFALIRRELS